MWAQQPAARCRTLLRPILLAGIQVRATAVAELVEMLRAEYLFKAADTLESALLDDRRAATGPHGDHDDDGGWVLELGRDSDERSDRRAGRAFEDRLGANEPAVVGCGEVAEPSVQPAASSMILQPTSIHD
jgi:hypothetical protein